MKKISLLFTFLFALTLCGFAQKSGYNVGDKAADFRLKNVDNSMLSLSDFPEAKGYIVIFTCNHCPYAKTYEDRIIALNDKYTPLGYPVIAINPNDPKVQPEDSFAKMQERAKEKGFGFAYLFDEGQKIYPQYGATRTPEVYLLEKTADGNIVRYTGAIDNNYEDADAATKHYVEDSVDNLLAGTPQLINPTFTKAIGCTIKAK